MYRCRTITILQAPGHKQVTDCLINLRIKLVFLSEDTTDTIPVRETNRSQTIRAVDHSPLPDDLNGLITYS